MTPQNSQNQKEGYKIDIRKRPESLQYNLFFGCKADRRPVDVDPDAGRGCGGLGESENSPL